MAGSKVEAPRGDDEVYVVVRDRTAGGSSRDSDGDGPKEAEGRGRMAERGRRERQQ